MKGRTLAVFAAVSALVVGYVVIDLVGRGDAHAPRTAAATAPAPEDPPREREAPKPRPAPAAKPEAKPAAPRAGGPPPPMRGPDISLDDARENYDAFIAELDREIERGDEVGRDLSNESWVEYYKQGHATLDPLLRLLDRADPKQAQELQEKQKQVRTKLQALQPRSEPSP